MINPFWWQKQQADKSMEQGEGLGNIEEREGGHV